LWIIRAIPLTRLVLCVQSTLAYINVHTPRDHPYAYEREIENMYDEQLSVSPREDQQIYSLGESAILHLAYGPPVLDTPYINGAHCRRYVGLRQTPYQEAREVDATSAAYAHQRVWEVMRKMPLPEDWQVHHLCGDPWCGEPAHLEAGPTRMLGALD
jgi:hypothetical protein